jgi:hypothetical protein
MSPVWLRFNSAGKAIRQRCSSCSASLTRCDLSRLGEIATSRQLHIRLLRVKCTLTNGREVVDMEAVFCGGPMQRLRGQLEGRRESGRRQPIVSRC